MATSFVWSGAAGANTGASWTDAWTSIASATGAAAGDEVRVEKTHAQTFTTSTTLNFSNGTQANPVKIFCCDKTNSDALATGAAINQTTAGALAWQGSIVVDGLTCSTSTNSSTISFQGTNALQNWYNSTFNFTGGSSFSCAGTTNLFRFFNCNIDNTNSTNSGTAFGLGGASQFFYGCTFTARAAGQTSLFSTGQMTFLEGCTLVNTVTNLVAVPGGGTSITLRRCKLPTYTNVVSAAIASTSVESLTKVILESCSSGTITVPPLGLTYLAVRAGVITSTLAVYRNGGANDGANANAYSWSLVTNANALSQYSWLESPPIVRWLAAGSYTLTFYVGSGTTLTNADFWVEVQSPSEAGSATAQARYQDTRCLDRATAANLTTDSVSTWTGTTGGTLQKVTVTIAPAVAGPVSVRLCLAKASQTVYVDPEIVAA